MIISPLILSRVALGHFITKHVRIIYFKQRIARSGVSGQEATMQRRKVLSKDNVIEIYKLRPDGSQNNKMRILSATRVARQYGVSSKTIRDIWVCRTWYRETFHLDPSRSDAAERLMRRTGRPQGAKDSKPRRPKGWRVRSSRSNQEEKDRSDSMLATDRRNQEESFDMDKNLPRIGAKGTSRDRSIGIDEFLEGHEWLEFRDPFRMDWPFWANTIQ